MNDKVVNLKKTWRQATILLNIIIFFLAFAYVLIYEHSLFEYPSDNGEKILFYLNWLIYVAITFTIVYLNYDGYGMFF